MPFGLNPILLKSLALVLLFLFFSRIQGFETPEIIQKTNNKKIRKVLSMVI